MWLEATSPVTFTVSLEGQETILEADERHAWALIPLPPLLEPGPRTLVVRAGDSAWRAFRRVTLPLVGPGVTSLAVFQWIWTWNMFLEPLIFLQKDELRPVGLAILFFQSRYRLDRGMVATGVVLTILPVILIYIFLQRKFVEGVTAGALRY